MLGEPCFYWNSDSGGLGCPLVGSWKPALFLYIHTLVFFGRTRLNIKQIIKELGTIATIATGPSFPKWNDMNEATSDYLVVISDLDTVIHTVLRIENGINREDVWWAALAEIAGSEALLWRGGLVYCSEPMWYQWVSNEFQPLHVHWSCRVTMSMSASLATPISI